MDVDVMLPETERSITAFLNWSAGFLLAGVWPALSQLPQHRGPPASYRAENAGTRLAGPWTAGFAMWKGDLKQKVRTHGLWGRNWAAHMICERCFASKMPGDMLFTNFAPDAPWRLTRHTHEAWCP
jgi:hypothetical protein